MFRKFMLTTGYGIILFSVRVIQRITPSTSSMTNVASCSSTLLSTRVRVLRECLDVAGPNHASLTRVHHCQMGQQPQVPALSLLNEHHPPDHPPGQNRDLLEVHETGLQLDLHVITGCHKFNLVKGEEVGVVFG